MKCLSVRIKFLFENVEGFEAVFADGHQLPVECLEGFERAGFGHDQDGVENRRIAMASG